MTKIESEFNSVWEELHEGAQLTVARRAEMKKIAREWFLRGTDFLANEINKCFENGDPK